MFTISTAMKIRGKVWKFGDNIDTDLIIPARYLVTTDPRELGQHCLEGLKPDFPQGVSKGDVLVAGANFGSGSSREHAPLAIKGAGISCVIAKSFARIFFRNAINIGLPIVEFQKVDEFCERDLVEVDFSKGKIKNVTRGKGYSFQKYPDFLQEIIKSGGLMKWARKMGKGTTE